MTTIAKNKKAPPHCFCQNTDPASAGFLFPAAELAFSIGYARTCELRALADVQIPAGGAGSEEAGVRLLDALELQARRGDASVSEHRRARERDRKIAETRNEGQSSRRN
ncbi:MAG: hypothetical protein E6K09_02975 [Methanobacteriota archaeon]|nr:MAG: hypothetical protein E6K09_02975 [Euryarchaeota archaeon]